MTKRGNRKPKGRPRARPGAKRAKLYVQVFQFGESTLYGPYRDEYARLAAAGRMWFGGENGFKRDRDTVMRADVRRGQPPDTRPFLAKELDDVKPDAPQDSVR